jgi:sulfopyruvate decarboxylase TPP-binding subunit
MAPAEGPTSSATLHEKASYEKASDEKAWHEVVLETFKRNDIRLVPYVPDRVLTTLIRKLHADPFFTTFPTAREEEAVGIVSGAWMGGMRGAVLMQTSGFATLEFIVDRSIKQAIATQAPVALILSPLLTGGKVFEK